MDPRIFRKGDASSVLVPEKTWGEVLDKPANLEAVAARVVMILEAASGEIGYTQARLLHDISETIRNKTSIPAEEYHEALNGIIEVYERLLEGDFQSRASVKTAVKSVLLACSPMGSDVDEATADILEFFRKASGEAYLMAKDTLGNVKEVLSRVLVNPLLAPVVTEAVAGEAGTGGIPTDAFWDEIEGAPEGLREAIGRFYQMKVGIRNYAGLGDEAGLGDVKYVLNNAVLQPLKGEVEYE